MRIVIAPDKFKGSLSGIEFCNIVADTILHYIPEAKIIKLPLADGGDGTVAALQYYLGGEHVKVTVYDPLMRKITARYLYAKNNHLAFIEMAEASGIRLLTKGEKNPQKTSTYGTGQLIVDALKKGAKQIILGIGGSATNDAGMGMARALGYRFFNQSGNELLGCGQDLNTLAVIDDLGVIPELKHAQFKVACDVVNPLYGKNGAAYIYGAQKGATYPMVKKLDLGLKNFNAVVKKKYGVDLQKVKGAGAAGGLGAAAKLFLNARLQSGISMIKEIANFNHHILNADWIITGEGKIDKQTFSGKVIQGITQEITHQQLAVFCGINQLSAKKLNDNKVKYLAEVSKFADNFADSVKHADTYLVKVAEAFTKKHLVS